MADHILVLGATSDIGRAIAHRFAESGYNVYLAGRRPELLEDDVKDLQIRYDISASAHGFDARKFDTHQAFYQQFQPPPQIVCVVFGVLPDQPAAEQDWDMTLNSIEVNFTGAASILHHVSAEMEKMGSGTIVGISSVAGDRGRASNYLYGSAKAGFTAYLSGLRNRLAKKGVHVVTVKPGFVYTAMTAHLQLPAPLTAQPQQVAKAIYAAVKKKKNVVYSKWMWRYIMRIIQHIPEGIFKKMQL